MKHSALSLTLAGALSLGAVAAITLTSTPADAQYRPPPAEVVATLVPAYHEGHAVYWYRGFWHYRDNRGAWAYYHTEPAYLHEWRGHHETVYHHYDHHDEHHSDHHDEHRR
jgi:hypothetical protein